MLRLRLLLVAALGLALLGVLLVDGRDRAASDREAVLVAGERDRHTFRQLTSEAHWASGSHHGTTSARGTLRMVAGHRTVTVGRQVYERATWVSGWVTPATGFSELVPSWDARTPPGTYVSVRVVARTGGGDRTRWKSIGRWTSANHALLRRSVGGAQEDALATVATDTLRAKPGVTFTAYRLAVDLHRRHGSAATPRVRSLHAVSSALAGALPPVSAPLLPGRVLPVPRYSQMIHSGEYPAYGGGGEAWCSPTSLAMVLAHFGAGPTPREYAWVDDSYADPWVDEAARRVYDHAYQGTGNWPFNTAYAATRLPRAVVTRLSSLRDAERFVAAGIPLVASVSFARGGLDGSPLTSTPGHLLVVVGFTDAGDVVVNDPAAATNRGVRRTYDRAQFEAAWLRRSHGLVYAVRDAEHRFPRGYVGR